MNQLTSGSLRLFRLAGITVFLHWSWLVVAFFEIEYRNSEYSSRLWIAAEYLTLFAIVLLHEFGHALACRSVGGTADTIVLWPLGGVAFVRPPQRPGPMLWSIAAGPLVNVVLLPLTVGLLLAATVLGWEAAWPDLYHYLLAVAVINFVLLFFNLLPIYPLDGGQIVQSLLWFVVGRARSLLVVSVIGLVVGAAVVGLAVLSRNFWLGLIAAFTTLRSWAGFQAARALALLDRAPRHAAARCPSCDEAPLKGPFWGCDRCGNRFDIFEHPTACPHCGAPFPNIPCPLCGQAHPTAAWYPPEYAAVDAREAESDPV